LVALAGCGRAARTTPVSHPGAAPTASAAAAVPAQLREPPRLTWMARWDGASPHLLASRGGRLALAVFGAATLGDTKLGADGPPSLWVVPLGPDRRPGRATRVAPGLTWSEPLALLDDGGLIIDGQKPGEATSALMRVRADGSVAWAQPLPADRFVAAAAADADGDTIGVLLAIGRVAMTEHGLNVAGSAGPSRTEELRGYDGAGRLRFTSALSSEQSLSCRSLAVGPRGGLFAGGSFLQDLRIERDGGGPPAIARNAHGTAWIGAWDAGGRVSWLRALPASGNDGWVERVDPLSDGAVRGVGLARGRLIDVVNAPVVDLDGAEAVAAPPTRGHGPAPKPASNRQRVFAVRLDGASGTPQAISYLPRGNATASWGDDLVQIDSSRPRDGERTWVSVLRASGGAGRAWWHTDLDADISAVRAAPDALLVSGGYNVVMTMPGREPPAIAIGDGFGSAFIAVLGWPSGRPLAAPAVLPPPAEPRFVELHARATRAFRGKHFKEACALFADAQRARPADAANMADLALCLQRLGDDDGAARANRYAIRLASVPDTPDDATRLRVRKSAYYNLGRLARGDTFFAALVSEFGCQHSVFDARYDGTTGGIHYLADYEIARFALDQHEVVPFQEDEYRSDWPQIGSDETATADAAGETSYDVTLSVTENFRDDQGETQASDTAGCALVFADGCSGHLGFDCSFEDRDGNQSSRVIELTLARDPPDAGD